MHNHGKLTAAILLAGAVVAGAQLSDEPALTNSAPPVPMKDRIAATTNVTAFVQMPINKALLSQRKYSWRFCYTGKALKIFPFWNNGRTWCPHKGMVEAPTVADMTNQFAVVGVVLTKDQAERVAGLLPVSTNAAAVDIGGVGR